MTFSSFSRYSSLVSFIFFATPVFADYYIDATNGNDVNIGTSPAEAWQTIDKVNNTLFQPGDQVLFKRGEEWHESLEVPTSGIAGMPITYSAYGTLTDPKPVISCTTDITSELWQGVFANGGFEQIDSTLPEVFPGWSMNGSVGNTVEQDTGYNSIFSAKLISNSGSVNLKTVPLHIEQGESYTISGAFQALASGTTIRAYLYTSDVSNYQYVDTNGDWAAWVPDDSSQKLQPFFTFTASGTSPNLNWQTFSLPAATYTGVDGVNTYLSFVVIGTNVSARIDDFKVIKNGSNYWTAPRGAIASKILIEDGVRQSSGSEWDAAYPLHSASSASALTRYLAPGSSLPSDHMIEMGERRRAIFFNDRDYINIDNLQVEGCENATSGNSDTEGAGILMTGGSSNNNVTNVLAINNAEGIRVQGAGLGGELNEYNIFSDFEVAHSIRQGIALRNHTKDSTIKNCYIHDLNMLDSDDLVEDKEPISIGGTTGNGPGILVENCEVARSGVYAQRGSGIVVFNSPQVTIRNNYVHDIGVSGIIMGVNGNSPFGYNSDGFEAYGNLIVRTGVTPTFNVGQGISVVASNFGDITDVKIYNNTIIGCELHDNKDGGISIRGAKNTDDSINLISDIEIKNNIVSGCFGTYPRALFVGSSAIVDVQNLTSDFNMYYPGSSITPTQSFISYKGQSYKAGEFQLYQQAQDQDGSSLMFDPLFINPASDNYHLQSISLGIDTGNQVDAYDNEPENNGQRINIGTYGNTSEAATGNDTDSDGLTDQNERCYDGNCTDYNPYHPVTAPSGTDLDATLPDTDGDGFRDNDEVTAGSDPLDRDSIPLLGDINNDGLVNVADVLLATRIVLGTYIPTVSETIRADIAPFSAGIPAPDGKINSGDMLIIIQLATDQLSY